MHYLKYTQYVYLIVAAFSFYKAFATWQNDTDEHFLFVAIGVMAVVMFLVRRKFVNRIGKDRDNRP